MTPLLLGSLISPAQCQSYLWLLLGPPCFKVCFPLQPQLQHSRCHHRSPLSQSPEGLPQAMQQDLIEKIQHLAPWSHQRAAPWGLYIQKGAFNPQWHAHAWLFYSRYLNSSSHTLIYKVEVPQWLSPFVFWAPFPGILWKTTPWTQWSEFLNLHSLLVACLPVQIDLPNSAALAPVSLKWSPVPREAAMFWSPAQLAHSCCLWCWGLAALPAGDEPFAQSICCRCLAITFLHC